jgi:hypothetical protein
MLLTCNTCGMIEQGSQLGIYNNRVEDSIKGYEVHPASYTSSGSGHSHTLTNPHSMSMDSLTLSRVTMGYICKPGCAPKCL